MVSNLFSFIQEGHAVECAQSPSNHRIDSLPFFESTLPCSYAGNLPSSAIHDNSFFYWLFPSSPYDGLTLYLNTKPARSMDTFFNSFGPLHAYQENPLDESSYRIFQSKTISDNLLYVDLPLGPSWSYESVPSTTSEEVANSFVTFLQNFFSEHPQYQDSQLTLFFEATELIPEISEALTATNLLANIVLREADPDQIRSDLTTGFYNYQQTPFVDMFNYSSQINELKQALHITKPGRYSLNNHFRQNGGTSFQNVREQMLVQTSGQLKIGANGRWKIIGPSHLTALELVELSNAFSQEIFSKEQVGKYLGMDWLECSRGICEIQAETCEGEFCGKDVTELDASGQMTEIEETLDGVKYFKIPESVQNYVLKLQSDSVPVDILINQGLNELPTLDNSKAVLKQQSNFSFSSDTFSPSKGLTIAILSPAPTSFKLVFYGQASSQPLPGHFANVFRAAADPSPAPAPKPGFEDDLQPFLNDPTDAAPLDGDICISDSQYIFLGVVMGVVVTLMYWPVARMAQKVKQSLSSEKCDEVLVDDPNKHLIKDSERGPRIERSRLDLEQPCCLFDADEEVKEEAPQSPQYEDLWPVPDSRGSLTMITPPRQAKKNKKLTNSI